MIKTRRYLGSVTRVSIILVYGATAFLVANHLGQTVPHRPGIGQSSATENPGEQIRLKLSLSSSRPVEIWSVKIDGRTIKEDSLTKHGWSAEIDLPVQTDQRMIIDVIPSQSLTESPLAVHLMVSSRDRTWEHTFWAADELVESVSLEPIWKAWEVTP
jgi:hypothetical protein